MGDSFPLMDIVLFALVAAFIVLRLRGVLGRRPGKSDSEKINQTHENEKKNVIPLPDRDQNLSYENENTQADIDANSPVTPGILQIQALDKAFSPDEFLQGARSAYEMVIMAYAGVDDDVLRQLLSDDVYDNFSSSIEERIAKGQYLDTTLLSIQSSDIVEARLIKGFAELTVKFVAEIINVIREEDGEVITGDPENSQEVTDYWTFSRELVSADPNWKLIETRSLQ